VIHGDIKAQNILLFYDGSKIPQLKISDFSHSIILSDFKGISPKFMPRYTGTRPFLIPEVRLEDKLLFERPSEAVDCPFVIQYHLACDVFALGILIFTIANGGTGLYSRVHQRLASSGLPHNEDAVESAVEALFQTPAGILHEGLGALNALFNRDTPEDFHVVMEVTREKFRGCFELCLQDHPEERGSSADLTANFNEGLVVVRGHGRISPDPYAPFSAYLTPTDSESMLTASLLVLKVRSDDPLS
jgi:serine/threonine protein kinase